MGEILIVEDDPGLRGLLGRLLEASGYRVTGAGTAGDALHFALSRDYDLILLDLNLPDLSGREVLRVVMTAKPASRVLVLSSVTEVSARLDVLENGAADFLLKPFVTAELLARIRLRVNGGAMAPATVSQLPVTAQAWLDTNRRELVVAGSRVPLSHREFTLLTHLLARRGVTCSREELLADVWGIGFDPGTNVVDVYVRRLRKKLMADTIETVRNVGYRLAAS